MNVNISDMGRIVPRWLAPFAAPFFVVFCEIYLDPKPVKRTKILESRAVILLLPFFMGAALRKYVVVVLCRLVQ